MISREVLLTTATTIGLISVLNHLRSIAFIHTHIVLITGAILIYIPLLQYWRHKQPITFLDRSFTQVGRSLVIFCCFTLAILFFLTIGNHVYQHYFLGQSYKSAPALPLLISRFMNQVLFIAFPEEFFFRGYIQDRLNAIYPKKWRLLGADLGKAWIYTAIVFAASHSVITIQWWHAFIFFPGLAFGWLRERTGTILAPILFHAFSNTFVYWAARAYG